jgi:DNA-binding XRE family transcriptional regulator
MAKKFWDRLTKIEKDAIHQGANLLGELRDKVKSGWRERSGEGAQNLSAGPALRELREAQQISQEELANRLDRTQSAISQIEKRGDLLLSTITQYVEAVEGELVHFTVRFPEGDIQVVPFRAKQEDSERKAQPDS